MRYRKELNLTRSVPKVETIRALFAFSGNHYAFPGCVHSVVNLKKRFVGQLS